MVIITQCCMHLLAILYVRHFLHCTKTGYDKVQGQVLTLELSTHSHLSDNVLDITEPLRDFPVS